MDTAQAIEHVIILAAAYALAFPIGWDREKEARSAGQTQKEAGGMKGWAELFAASRV